MLHHKMGYPSKGHTLLEVCLVILLISLIMSFGFKVASLPSSVLVRSELERLATVVTYLQRKALIEDTSYTITFTESSYQTDTTYTLSTGRFGVIPGVKGPPADPQHEIKSCNKLVIGPQGISAGTVYLTDGRYLYALSSDASEVSCIRKYRYTTKWESL